MITTRKIITFTAGELAGEKPHSPAIWGGDKPGPGDDTRPEMRFKAGSSVQQIVLFHEKAHLFSIIGEDISFNIVKSAGNADAA